MPRYNYSNQDRCYAPEFPRNEAMVEQDGDTGDSVENARVVFQQYWLHARHVENHRLWLTNLFVIIFAGLLGSIAFIEETVVYIPFAGFALSLIGLFTVHASRIPFLHFSRLAETIMVVELGLGEYKRFFLEKKDKSWTLHHTFIVFYCLAGGGWLALSLRPYVPSHEILVAAFVVVTVGLYTIYRLTFWRRESEVQEQLRNLLNGLGAENTPED